MTASAVCMAESGGQASVYHCDATGRDGVVAFVIASPAAAAPSAVVSG